MYALYHTKGKTDIRVLLALVSWRDADLRTTQNTCTSQCRFADQSTSSLGRYQSKPVLVFAWCWFFFAWISMTVTSMSATTSQQKKKEIATLFLVFSLVHAPFWHWHRDWAAKYPLVRFFPFSNDILLNPLPPILNRLRLETNYEFMIWSISYGLR